MIAYALGLVSDLLVVAAALFAASMLLLGVWVTVCEVVRWNEQRSHRARLYRVKMRDERVSLRRWW